MGTNQPSLLDSSLEYLVALNNKQLIILVLAIFREDDVTLHTKQDSERDFSNLQLLVAVDPNIIALEVMLYIYRYFLAQDKKKATPVGSYNLPNQMPAQYFSVEVESYISQIHDILVAWQQAPQRSNKIVALLTKIYQKQIIVLQHLFEASSAAVQQLSSFSLILNSQIVSMKNLIKKTSEQKKSTGQEDKAQLERAVKLEQFTVKKLFPALMKKLTHDQSIFYTKHRFMAEEFKIFLHERQNLAEDSRASELAAANIYALLKGVQLDIAAEIKFGAVNAK